MTHDVGEEWLRRFHAGEKAALAECYREHFQGVFNAVRPILGVTDGETVVHDVFVKLIAQAEVRGGFTGGSMGGWLRTIARRAALDFLRRYQRELPADPSVLSDDAPRTESFASSSEARMLLDKFRREVLPPKWAAVFEARFLHRLDQREAARRLQMRRTTLAYQEQRIARLLRKFVLRENAA